MGEHQLKLQPMAQQAEACMDSIVLTVSSAAAAVQLLAQGLKQVHTAACMDASHMVAVNSALSMSLRTMHHIVTVCCLHVS